MIERDFGVEAQKAAEDHLENCWQWLNWTEDYDQDDDSPPPMETDPASAPFDGCMVCIVREVLYAAWPIIAESKRQPSKE